MEARAALTQLRRGVVPYCVLAMLEHDARYGVELVRDLAGRGLVAGEGTVYPLLGRLRDDGLVDTVWQESDAGPPRRYYRLSADGRIALAGFRDAWQVFRDSADDVLTRGRPRDARQ